MAKHERKKPYFKIDSSALADQRYIANPSKKKRNNGKNMRVVCRDNIKNNKRGDNKDLAYPSGLFLPERDKYDMRGAYHNKKRKRNVHKFNRVEDFSKLRL
jgi:hypothetical protein